MEKRAVAIECVWNGVLCIVEDENSAEELLLDLCVDDVEWDVWEAYLSTNPWQNAQFDAMNSLAIKAGFDSAFDPRYWLDCAINSVKNGSGNYYMSGYIPVFS